MEGFSEYEMELSKGLLINVRNNQNEAPPNLRWKNVKAATIKINKIINIMSVKTITEANMLLLAAANSVANMVGCKKRESRSFFFQKFVRFLKFTKFGYCYINQHKFGLPSSYFITFKDTVQFNVSNNTITFRI